MPDKPNSLADVSMAYRPTEKTEARKKAQHKLLSDSALSIVSKGGFKALTIASLAQEANVAIGTIYKYFEDKAELCAHVFRIASGKEVEMVRRFAFPDDTQPDDDNTCTARLERTIHAFSKRAIAGHKLAYALIAEPIDPMVEAERLVYREAYAEIFQKLIEQGISNGEFRQQNAFIAGAAIVGALAETLIVPLEKVSAGKLGTQQNHLIESINFFCLNAVK
jgi:AcrR family transcriptional regulator